MSKIWIVTLLLAGSAALAGQADPKKKPGMPGVDQPPPQPGAGLMQVGPHNWEMTHDEAVQAVASMPFIARQLWVRKVHVRGMFVGYKLKNISKDSLVYRAGFRDSDIVFRINGMTMEDPFGLLISLLDAKQAIVEIERKRKTHKQTYKFVTHLSKPSA